MVEAYKDRCLTDTRDAHLPPDPGELSEVFDLKESLKTT